MIKSIFVNRVKASMLAYAFAHRVAGITLPPADANPNLFINPSVLRTGDWGRVPSSSLFRLRERYWNPCANRV